MKHVSLSVWSRRSTLVAVGYLVAAGALLGIIGASVAGPDAQAYAESLERRTAAELAAITESAAALRATRMDHSALKTAVGAFAAWSGRAVDDLPMLPEGVAAAVISTDGEIELELGAFDLASPSLVSIPLADGRTAAVAAARGTLAEAGPPAFGISLSAGIGLYFIDSGGRLAESLSGRPRQDAPLATPVSSGSMRTASGNLKQGRLVTARTAVASTGLTAVAERFLTPAELTAPGSPAAAVAVAVLGLLLSLAFCHALAVTLRREEEADAVDVTTANGVDPASRVGPTAPAASPAVTLKLVEDDAGFVFGRSIRTLRDTLGAGNSGPDLAACARSPILRALSRHVRHAKPADIIDELDKAA